MKPRLDGGYQTTERRELLLHGRTGDCIAAHAHQLVLELWWNELTKPPTAQLVKIDGDEKTFDHNPFSKQLAEYVVPKRLDAIMQHSLPHKRESLEESTISVVETQQIRVLRLIAEVLERRSILCGSVRTRAKQRRTMKTKSTHSVHQQALKTTSNLRRREDNNPRTVTAQQERDCINAPSSANNTPITLQESQAIRILEIVEKATECGITMSLKVYIPSPPPEVKCNYVGRIIGPNGMTIREFQRATRCQITIHGRGSVRDRKLLRQLRYRSGREHLSEDTHVLVEAE
ncbi:hypothetical protein KIN20_001719 [Parelaphostrongylus tenuis]|uniref:K Homology domain-containing protein n=1 Tax=Parelaphostrongylus tenuis TaxID=148309 RepID=A0AAD5MFP6_PARTN|nr:hypothetical protein KIN20_001719 [Parelaphostrongylus tenuis]